MSSSTRPIVVASGTVALIGILCIVGGLMLPFHYAGSIGPAWLPLLIGVLLLVCAVAHAIVAARAKEDVEWTDRAGWLTIAAIFGSFVVFLVVAQLTFFAVGAAVFIALFLTSIRTYSIVKRLIVAVLSAAAIHLLFVTLLELPLPGAWR
jgi:hypothetical protein